MWVYAACYRGYNVEILSGLTKPIGNDEPYSGLLLRNLK